MRFIPLTQGKFAAVDDADFDNVQRFKWHARKVRGVFYAGRTVSTPKGPRVLALHVFLMPNAERIDHKDGDGLNNTRGNLRTATHQQNCQARRRKKLGTSQYRGVYFYSSTGKWKAQITAKGKRQSLGYFENERDAARAYDVAAQKFFGSFAQVNLTN